MVLTASNQWELIGVSSFGGGTANPHFGSGYTRITSSIAFIQENLHRTSMSPTAIICSCQCPRGTDSGYAYSTVNSLAGCVQACMAVTSNPCTMSNTLACLGSKCAYTVSYNHKCTCQCPRGTNSGYAYTTEYSTKSCVNACKAVLLNPCTSSNTYACHEDTCAYSDEYRRS
jgi:hypothetical protein